MAISSKVVAQEQEVKEASQISKTLEPGNCKARIYDLQLMEGYKHDENGSLHLVIYLEGEPRAQGFEGFFIDKDNESLGRFKGQIGRVKASNFAFETKSIEIKRGPNKGSTIELNRDEEIAKVLVSIAKAQNKLEEYDITADTIEEYVEKSKAVLCNNIYLNWCLGGRQYQDAKGYDKWDLNLPYDKNRKKFPFGSSPDTVIKYIASEHTTLAKKAEVVDSFATTDDNLAESGEEFQV